MKSSRWLVIFCTAACLLFYGLMILGEIARQAAGINFAEAISWSRMAAALVDGPLRMPGFQLWDYVAWAGMAWILIFAARGRRISPWASLVYILVLNGAGGWIGLVYAFYLPYNLFFVFDSMTGEFFIDCARPSACGVWTILMMIWTTGAFRHQAERPVISTQACPIA